MRQHIDLHPVIVDHRNDDQAFALPAPEWFDPIHVRIIRAKDLSDGDLVLGDCEQPTRRGMYYAGYCLAAYPYDSTLYSLADLNLNPDELLIVQPAATLSTRQHQQSAQSNACWAAPTHCARQGDCHVIDGDHAALRRCHSAGSGAFGPTYWRALRTRDGRRSGK